MEETTRKSAYLAGNAENVLVEALGKGQHSAWFGGKSKLAILQAKLQFKSNRTDVLGIVAGLERRLACHSAFGEETMQQESGSRLLDDSPKLGLSRALVIANGTLKLV